LFKSCLPAEASAEAGHPDHHISFRAIGETDGHADGYDEGYSDGAAKGGKHCLGNLTVVTSQEVTISKKNARYISRLALSPLAAHVDGQELDDIGYGPIADILDRGSAVVEIQVPFDQNNPPVDQEATNDLLRTANTLNNAISIGLSGDDDTVMAPRAVSGPTAFPDAPMTVRLGQYVC
jgi:hypothetical protein